MGDPFSSAGGPLGAAVTASLRRTLRAIAILAAIALLASPPMGREGAHAQDTPGARPSDAASHPDTPAPDDEKRGRKPDDQSELHRRIQALGEPEKPPAAGDEPGEPPPISVEEVQDKGTGTDRGSDDPKTTGGDATSTQTRTRDGKCTIAVTFGVRVFGPNAQNDEGLTIPFAGAQANMVIPTNGHVGLPVRNLRVGPLPGVATFTFLRGAAGADDVTPKKPSYVFALHNANDVAQFNKGIEAPGLYAPDGMDDKHPTVAERIKVVASYKADSLPAACQVEGEIVVKWTWNGKPDTGNFDGFKKNWVQPDTKNNGPDPKVWVKVDKSIIDETTGFPGKINKATETFVVFKVTDQFGCCKTKGRNYAIVQFVRHRWKLGNGNPQDDGWNLDGSSTQSERHRQGLSYDPTYTNHPGEAKNDLVQLGPWDGQDKPDPAVAVLDFPGLLAPQHAMFGKEGGWIQWEFLTLLVCVEQPPTETKYLASGQVEAMAHYIIKRTYAEGDPTPVVVSKEPKQTTEEWPIDPKVGHSESFKACVSLRSLLEKYGDDLMQAFKHPQPHVIKLKPESNPKPKGE
ncbi:MAG: hypothetical protein ACHP7N_02850 [Caulobacterales bacterium]